MRGPRTNDRDSPLPLQTGHGDFPHPAFVGNDSSGSRLQQLQSERLQVFMVADPFRAAPRALTASPQMVTQPLFDEVIEFAEALPRIAQAEVPTPALAMPVESPDQIHHRRHALLRSCHLPQRFPFSGLRLGRGFPVPVAPVPPSQLVTVEAETVAEEVQVGPGFRDPDHPGFLPVDRNVP